MLDKNLKRPLVTLAVTAGLLATAGPASADVVSPGLGASSVRSANEIAIESFRPEVNDEVLVYYTEELFDIY